MLSLLLPCLFLATTAMAAGVRGSTTSPPLIHNGECYELLDMTVSKTQTLVEQERCHSFGFLYRGGKCRPDSTNCQDLTETLPQDKAYIIVTDVTDSSIIYHEGLLVVGTPFHFSLLQDSQLESMPDAYNISVYTHNEDKENIFKVESMVQTMIVQAPCQPSIEVTEGPTQLVFSARAPPTRQWQVDITSLSNEAWTLEWIQTTSSDTTQFAQGELLQGHATKSMEIPITEEEEAEGIHIVAQLKSTSGRTCLCEHTSGGAMESSL